MLASAPMTAHLPTDDAAEISICRAQLAARIYVGSRGFVPCEKTTLFEYLLLKYLFQSATTFSEVNGLNL
jgi:hypothetical protein